MVCRRSRYVFLFIYAGDITQPDVGVMTNYWCKRGSVLLSFVWSCEVSGASCHWGTWGTWPPRQYCLMFHFLKSSWKAPEYHCYHEARFLAWNSPNTVWRPGSARTRWGSIKRSLRPPSRNKGGLLLRGGKGKGEERRGREGKGGGPTSKGKRKGEGGKGKGGERRRRGRWEGPPFWNPKYATVFLYIKIR